MSERLNFKHRFTCIVVGPTGAGKTSFTIRLLQNLESLFTESNFRVGIIWCYSEETAVPREKLNKLGRPIQYQEGPPEKFGDAQGAPSLIILEDLLNQIYSRDCVICLRKAAITETLVFYFNQKCIPSGFSLQRHFTKRKIGGSSEKRQRHKSVPLLGASSLS